VRDLIIIGGGPAGLTAGIYASRARLDVVLLEATATGGQILTSDLVENYPGFPGGISGAELMERMAEQARLLALPVESGEVASVDFSSPEKVLFLANGQEMRARSIILATGATHRRLGVPGEDRLFGRGVSFCATCDGPFYRGKTVAAVGGGDEEDGARRGRRQDEGQKSVVSQGAEGLFRTVGGGGQSVGAQAHPGQERDQGDAVKDRFVLDVVRRAENKAFEAGRFDVRTHVCTRFHQFTSGRT